MSVIEHPLSPERLALRPRVKLTRQMVQTLLDSGLLSEGPFELIDGEILQKMGKKRPHVHATMRALGWLIGVFGIDFVQKEDPIAINDTNEPEPDLVVLAHPEVHYLAAGTPPASDVRLLIEVSDTTLTEDRRVKARLYAEGNIPDYWVIDLTGRQVFVHRHPQNDEYRSVIVHGENESISPLAAPLSPVLISTLLP